MRSSAPRRAAGLTIERFQAKKRQSDVEQIRKRLHEDPSPFTIRLSDGRRFPIAHQDFIAIGKHLVVVISADDSTVKIDPLHIVSLDDVRAKNGRKR